MFLGGPLAFNRCYPKYSFEKAYIFVGASRVLDGLFLLFDSCDDDFDTSYIAFGSDRPQ